MQQHKSDRIRELDKNGRTVRQIADVVGCPTSYVRVVLRQRVGGGMSKHDKAHLIKKHGSLKAAYAAHYQDHREYFRAYWAKRWREDPAYRAAHYERVTRYRQEARNDRPHS